MRHLLIQFLNMMNFLKRKRKPFVYKNEFFIAWLIFWRKILELEFVRYSIQSVASVLKSFFWTDLLFPFSQLSDVCQQKSNHPLNHKSYVNHLPSFRNKGCFWMNGSLRNLLIFPTKFRYYNKIFSRIF
jgi:hypothetical protein